MCNTCVPLFSIAATSAVAVGDIVTLISTRDLVNADDAFLRKFYSCNGQFALRMWFAHRAAHALDFDLDRVSRDSATIAPLAES